LFDQSTLPTSAFEAALLKCKRLHDVDTIDFRCTWRDHTFFELFLRGSASELGEEPTNWTRHVAVIKRESVDTLAELGGCE
jgi:hypothetical protein